MNISDRVAIFNKKLYSQTLERLSDESDSTFSEVLRKSLPVYDLLQSELKQGGSIVIRTKKGEK